MGVRKEKFSDERMEKLKSYLEFYHSQGKPVDYEIIVDDFRAVRRTDNPEDFARYKMALDERSLMVSVLFYLGKSNHHDKVILSLE